MLTQDVWTERNVVREYIEREKDSGRMKFGWDRR